MAMKMKTLFLNHGELLCSMANKSLILCIPLFHAHSSVFVGKPVPYAEYFSLNQTTAELQLLKPIKREQYQHFDLVIKVIMTTLAAKCSLM